MTTGYDTTWELETGENTGVFQELEGVRSGGLPKGQRAKLDKSHMKSPNHTLESESGFIDPGDLSLAILYEPANATDELLEGWKAAGDKRRMRCRPANKTLRVTFPATFGDWDVPLEHDAVSVGTLTVNVSGASSREYL